MIVKPGKFILIIIALGLATATSGSDTPIHVIKFHDYETGSEEDWLIGKGFEFRRDMQRRDRIDLEIESEGLKIEAKRRAFGMMLNEAANISEFSRIEIDWGVYRFPDGSSYEQGVRNEALMLIVFMGDERLPSGSALIRTMRSAVIPTLRMASSPVSGSMTRPPASTREKSAA